ncbi:MAG: ParB N-terminal domain-containing protein, partial [Candidatus Micrarchaeota archaeon]
MKAKISDINVGVRQRRELGNIESLADSINRYGVLQPIVVDDDLNLVAGERRLKACQLLGWQEVEVRSVGTLSEVERQELELEENIRRKQLTWAEEVVAVRRLHLLKQALHGKAVKGQGGGWGQKETMECIGEKSTGAFNVDLELAQGLELFPDLAKEKTKTAALRKLRRLAFTASREYEDATSPFFTVEEGDALVKLEELRSNSVHLAIIDPPWGVDFDKSSAAGRWAAVFQDSPDTALGFLKGVAPELQRVLVPDAHLYVFFGMLMYVRVYQVLQNYFDVNPVPLIWDKGTTGGGASTYSTLQFIPNYETIFFCRKGSRPLLSSSRSVFSI